MEYRGLSIQKDKLSVSEKLLLLSIIVSPLRCYGLIIAGLNFSPFRMVSILMFITYAIGKKGRFVLDNTIKVACLIVLFSVLQAFYSPSISGSRSNFFSVTFGYIWIIFAYSIMRYNNKVMSHIYNSIAIASIFPIGLGLYQWVVYKSSGVVPPLPFSQFVAAEGKLGMTYNIYVRITSCFGDPSYFATFLVIVAGYFLQANINMEKSKANKLKRLVGLGLVAVAIVEILMSMSVTGIVGLLVSGVVIMFLNMSNKKSFVRLILVCSIIIVGLIVYLKATNSELVHIVEFKLRTTHQSEGNLYGRMDYIKNALNAFLDHPLLGVGFGGLNLQGSFSSAHNSLLSVLGQQGIIVFSLHLYLLLLKPAAFHKAKHSTAQLAIYQNVLVPMVGILTISLAYDTLYSLDTCYVVIMLVLAACIEERGVSAYNRISSEDKVPSDYYQER